MAVDPDICEVMIIVAVVVVNNVSRYIPEDVAVRSDSAGEAIEVQSFPSLLILVAKIVRNFRPIAAERAIEEVDAARVSSWLTVLPARTSLVTNWVVCARTEILHMIELNDVVG